MEAKTTKEAKQQSKPVIDPLSGGGSGDPLSATPTSDPLSSALLDPLSQAAAESASAPKKVWKIINNDFI